MKITGRMLIGASAVIGNQRPIFAVNPSTGDLLQPAFAGGDEQQVEQACALAASAFDVYRNLPLSERAKFLDTIAEQIMALGDLDIEREGRGGSPTTRHNLADAINPRLQVPDQVVPVTIGDCRRLERSNRVGIQRAAVVQVQVDRPVLDTVFPAALHAV